MTIIIKLFHCISFGFQHASYAAGAAFRGVRGGGAPPGGRGGPGGAESPSLRRGVRRAQLPKIVCAHNVHAWQACMILMHAQHSMRANAHGCIILMASMHNVQP